MTGGVDWFCTRWVEVDGCGVPAFLDMGTPGPFTTVLLPELLPYVVSIISHIRLKRLTGVSPLMLLCYQNQQRC